MWPAILQAMVIAGVEMGWKRGSDCSDGVEQAVNAMVRCRYRRVLLSLVDQRSSTVTLLIRASSEMWKVRLVPMPFFSRATFNPVFSNTVLRRLRG
jgi:hypothetical protein